MSIKSQIIQEFEEDKKKESPQTQINTSHPFNMKKFWKSINEYQFSKKLCDLQIPNLILLVYYMYSDLESWHTCQNSEKNELLQQ